MTDKQTDPISLKQQAIEEAARPHPETEQVRAALDDLSSHYEAWRVALVRAFGNAPTSSDNDDDKLYWMRELRAFDRTFKTLRESTPLPSEGAVAWRGSDDAIRNLIAREIWRYQECPWDFDKPDAMMGELQKQIAVDQAEGIRKVVLASAVIKAYFAHHASPPPASGEVREESPDDIRALGWTVAIHNDYRIGGKACTFWLFVRKGIAVKGEGPTDAHALNEVRRALASGEKSA